MKGGREACLAYYLPTIYENKSQSIPTGGSEGGRNSLMGTHKLVCAWRV